MKPILSIINKLSPEEIETFRRFLSSHCRTGKNRKLELFDFLVNHSDENDPADFSDPLDKKGSRQSAYQLKKRLQQELYCFLISQDQPKNTHDQLFLEMDCHKKLYCFKILFDKGVEDHAHQILNQVLDISVKHSLHSLYLEAIRLKNIYFPLTKTSRRRKILVNSQIKKLKKSISRNLYINQYLSDSRNLMFESDVYFRQKLIRGSRNLVLAKNEYVIGGLIGVNQLFYQRDFVSAYNKLIALAENHSGFSGDINLLGLVYIEMVKACICIGDIPQGREWMSKAEFTLGEFESFLYVLLELRFIISLRSGDREKVKWVIDRISKTREISDNEVLAAKWLYYSLFPSFESGEFKKVIKVANSNPVLMVKNKSCLINVKVLEILSISHLQDPDWLYYKIENLRKIINGTEGKYQRSSQIVNLLKATICGNKLSASDIEGRIRQIENQFPWHPLSNELVNFCSYIHHPLKVPASVSDSTVVVESSI
jgi:hypothetical protein